MKQFKGVISNWNSVDNHIHGTCVFHTTHGNGNDIHTSEVVSMKRIPGSSAMILETKNSMYVLV